MKVIEIDLLYTYTVYFICIECTSFYEFLAICSTILVIFTFFFAFAHSMNATTEAEVNRKRYILLLCKIVNVTLTIIAFVCLFISEFSFDIGEDITNYAVANGISI